MTDRHSAEINDLQMALDRMRRERDRFQYIAHLFYQQRFDWHTGEIRHISDMYEEAVRSVY